MMSAAGRRAHFQDPVFLGVCESPPCRRPRRASSMASTISRCLRTRRRRLEHRHVAALAAAAAASPGDPAPCARRRQVALAHDQDVGDLEDARLDRLHVVAQPGRADDDAGVGQRRDFDIRLAGADRLDDHRVEPRGVQHVDDRGGRARQPAEMAARGQRADEDALVRAECRPCGCDRRAPRRR